MKKEVHVWHSPNLNQPMPIAVYGEFGRPLLFFPTAAADFEEYERFQLIDSISHLIDAGVVKAYSINSINRQSWLNDHMHPGEKAWRQVQFDSYIAEEVVPFIRDNCRSNDIGIGVTGASMGAFHAANEFFKHPDMFTTLIAMSGSYDIRGYCDGYWDNNCYFNNPVDYLVNLHDDWYLSNMRRNRIVISSGQGSYEAPDRSRQLSALLHAKAIPHWLDLWGYDVPHDWPTWRQMLNVYLPQLF